MYQGFADSHSKKPAKKTKKKKKKPEVESMATITVSTKKQYKEDHYDLILEADETQESDTEKQQPPVPQAPPPVLEQSPPPKPPSPKQKRKKSGGFQKMDVSQCEIFGYILLTKPAHLRCLDPITVGCLFRNVTTGRVFIRVKKLMFKIDYLTQFIEVDPDTGFYFDKLTQSSFFELPANSQNTLSILNRMLSSKQHQIIDMNAIFLRNLAKGQSKKQGDSRFQILQEICEAEIEVADCQSIVDYTKCSYSVLNQESIHLLVKNTDSTFSLRQYSVAELEEPSTEEPSFANSPRKVQIKAGSFQNVGSEFSRVLQFEHSVVVVSPKKAQVIS
mmetsp:Transcript_13543/g.21102  ORF Transcript_13543/g.21102 Transcript_13543/m.21102 type:complete len:332 (-) Transcript_13543:14288-15283(-)